MVQLEVVLLIHSFERQSHSVPQRHNAPEKSSTHLIEAHDWMGPESLTDSAQVKQVVSLPVTAEFTKR